MHDDLGADRVKLGDVFNGDFLLLAFALLLGFVVADDFDGAVAGCGENVPVVQEGVFGLSDIDEGGLEAGFEVLDLALEDGAHFAGLAAALDFELFQHAVLELRNALLKRFRINDQFRVALFRREWLR